MCGFPKRTNHSASRAICMSSTSTERRRQLSTGSQESFVGPVRVRLHVASTTLSRLYERTPEGKRGVVRLRKPLQPNDEVEPTSSNKSEQRKPRVRKPRRRKADLDPETKEVIQNLQRNFESVNLRRLEVRRYEVPNGVQYLTWIFHEPGKVAYEGSGETLSQALASVLDAARNKLERTRNHDRDAALGREG